MHECRREKLHHFEPSFGPRKDEVSHVRVLQTQKVFALVKLMQACL